MYICFRKSVVQPPGTIVEGEALSSRMSWTLVVTILVLGSLCGRAEAQRPAAPPPAPPAAGGADKPTGDALAQEAEAKPKEPEDEKDKKEYEPLTGHFAAGFNFTKGNSDTRSFNLALLLQYDPRTKNVVKADAFYILNYEAGTSTVDRTSAHLRDEYYFRPRWFAFGDGQFLKDQFKQITYLFAPTAGIGTQLVKTSTRELLVDLGAGAILEKDEPGDRTSSGALRAGESYSWKLSKSANFTQNAFALWKTSDLGDAYYHLDVGLGAAINDHFELKVALIDEYKRKPPDPTVKRNDLAGIVSIGYKL
jgi:putative salt-induced outer membrane protein YdiY